MTKGECDLQDQSLFFGFTKQRFYKFKRVISNKELGPILKIVITRYIHCTRCVKVATEITGTEELKIFGRGNSSKVETYIGKMLTTELSGNVISMCPVGASIYTTANQTLNKNSNKQNSLIREYFTEKTYKELNRMMKEAAIKLNRRERKKSTMIGILTKKMCRTASFAEYAKN